MSCTSEVHEERELGSESRAAWDLRRSDREDPLPERLGHHGGRTHARLSVRPSGGKLLGVHAAELFRPPPWLQQPPEGCDQHNEFRAMVKALHEADIEVILDVVYNHTAEGDQRGPVYSYKGIDNSTYYLMSGQPGNPYADYSGTGNTLAARTLASASWSWTARVIGSRKCTSTASGSTWPPPWPATMTVR